MGANEISGRHIVNGSLTYLDNVRLLVLHFAGSDVYQITATKSLEYETNWETPTSYKNERGQPSLVMAGRSQVPEVSEEQMEAVLGFIDEDTKMSVRDLANATDYSDRQVQRILEVLMERGKITSTPDWQYRQSRRREA